MRAVESGIKALAGDVGKTYDVQQWNVILNEIEAEIGNMRRTGIPGLSKQQKDDKLEFSSRAAAQIGYFKDGWRNYTNHNKRAYDVNEATSVFDHVGPLWRFYRSVFANDAFESSIKRFRTFIRSDFMCHIHKALMALFAC
jgi:hypothetical protein